MPTDYRFDVKAWMGMLQTNKQHVWGDGPWRREVDFWRYKFENFDAWACRNAHMGHWCGYVRVEPGHPWHGLDLFYVDADVHGGISHVGPLPPPGPEGYWVGFDCAHYNDLQPSMSRALITALRKKYPGEDLFEPPGATYKDLDYVKQQLKRLAEQARDVCH